MYVKKESCHIHGRFGVVVETIRKYSTHKRYLFYSVYRESSKLIKKLIPKLFLFLQINNFESIWTFRKNLIFSNLLIVFLSSPSMTFLNFWLDSWIIKKFLRKEIDGFQFPLSYRTLYFDNQTLIPSNI